MTAFERRFALVTLVVLTCLGVGLYALLAHFTTQLALDSAAAETRRESLAVARVALNQPLDRPLDPASLARVDQAVKAFLPNDYAAVKIWSPSGRVLYATEPEIIGKPFPLSPELQAALKGETKGDLNHTDEKEENRSERQRGFAHLLEVYTPIQAADGRVVGAFELYRSADFLLLELRRERHLLAIILAAGLVALWISLLAWVRQASATLTRQNTALQELSAKLRASYEQLHETTRGALLALSEAVEAKDAYTAGHVARVRDLALAVGRRLRVDDATMTRLEYGALLHDIGKLSVDDAILRKPGPLDEHERRVMQAHTVKGEQLVRNVPGLVPAATAVRSHHERWDGTGYPDGLAGEAIPLEARIIAVADAFDAMTTDRPYRRALDLEAACDELLRHSGRQFDPRVVQAVLQEIRERRPSRIDQGQPPGSAGTSTSLVPLTS